MKLNLFDIEMFEINIGDKVVKLQNLPSWLVYWVLQHHGVNQEAVISILKIYLEIVYFYMLFLFGWLFHSHKICLVPHIICVLEALAHVMWLWSQFALFWICIYGSPLRNYWSYREVYKELHLSLFLFDDILYKVGWEIF